MDAPALPSKKTTWLTSCRDRPTKLDAMLLALVTMAAFGASVPYLMQHPETESPPWVFYLSFVMSAAAWCHRDAMQYGQRWAGAIAVITVLASPGVVLPIYLVWTRGWRAGGIATLRLIAFFVLCATLGLSCALYATALTL